jgi:predicted dehydrogenase
MYARELVRDGFVGEVLAVNFTYTGQAVTQRGAGRIWQGERRNGANTLTIAAGHSIDALCYVLGEFEELSARLATNLAEWRNPDTGETMHVDSPDWINVTGRLSGGAQAAFLVTTVPANPSGTRWEIFGRDGTLVLTCGSVNQGPVRIVGSRGREPLEAMDPPNRFNLVPASLPSGAPFNVGQAYSRFASALAADQPFTPDFASAVTRHRLIEAIEHSAAEGRSVRPEPSPVATT